MKRGDRMKFRKSIALMFLCLLIGFTSISSFAEIERPDQQSRQQTGTYSLKDEVVYGKLSLEGEVNSLYVVNSFSMSKPGTIIDYGAYESVRNLTNLNKINQMNGDEVHLIADEEKYYYQGNLKDLTLPWEIDINYFLDGKEINPKQLAGKNGDLEIQIVTKQNEQVNPVFYENYILQIAVTFNPDHAEEIHAPKGTEANVGKDKQITFTVLPEQDEVLILTAQIENFEMDPIEIAAIPANIAFDTLDLDEIEEGMRTLSEAIQDLNHGVGALKDGIDRLRDGSKELAEGSSEYKGGLQELTQSGLQLVKGSNQIKQGLIQMNQGVQSIPDLPDLDEIKPLPNYLRRIADEIEQTMKDLDLSDDVLKEWIRELERLFEQLPETDFTEDFESLLNLLEESDVDPRLMRLIEELYKGYEAAREFREKYHDEIEEVIEGIQKGIEQLPEGINAVVTILRQMAQEIEESLESFKDFDQLLELQKGFHTLTKEYQTFHDGLSRYVEGMHEVSGAYQKIHEGIEGFSDGTISFADGIYELHEGTGTLARYTEDLPIHMQSEIEEMLSEYDFSDFEPQSFVSEKNEKIGIVQFVLQTERIEMEERDLEEVEEQKKGFWARILDLFRKKVNN